MRFTFSHQKLIENKIAPFRCSTWENFHVYLRAIRVLINGRHDFSLGKIAHFDRQFWGLFFCVLSKRAERSCVKHGLSFFQNCLPERLKQKNRTKMWSNLSEPPVQDIHRRFSIANGEHVWSIFLPFLCYSLITTLRSRALHRVLLQQFNAPDALVCYTGSIERLKLLGATYLPNWCSYVS